MVRAAQRNDDVRALEHKVAQFWSDHDVYRKVKAHRQGGKPYYFLDGPPYATGHIHIGTARNKILKDVFVRHMRARGYNVRDQPGYDMHGLPIEVKVEKELGIKTKKEIEEHGIDRFVEACRTFALDHLQMMNGEFRELAVWLDWDKPYMTITNEYIEGAWWAIEKAHERGLLFESERVLTWCWRCETALANAEVEFEEREDPSIYVKFPLKDEPNTFLVVWTTTPWTLPANMAIAANPDLAYSRVRVRKDGRDETLIVATAQAEHVAKVGRYEHFEVLVTISGSQLEGLRYVHPFGDLVPHQEAPRSEWSHRVILGAHVAGDRSGLVHTATGHGVEDFEAGKKYGIPVYSPVGENGRYTDVAGALAGLQVKSPDVWSEADQRVVEILAERNLLVSKKTEKHSYGHCWRCKNPLVFRATNQWFIEIPKIKEKMIAETKRVQWTPEWAGSARQMDWVEQARDWCISRQRYWGIPLPIWRCTACAEVTVIGSRRELHHVSDYTSGDLHRPWIDKVRVACPRRGCGGVMKRVPDVLDVWFDSAVASWASLQYPSHKHAFDELFPAKWIVEGLDQTRGWFYSQLAAGVAAMDQVPYERVLMHGWVNDAQGRPMSKSLGNIVMPNQFIAKFGCDAFRMGLIGGAAPWDDVSFGEDTVRAAQRNLNILWNVHVFATQYMAADGYKPQDGALATLTLPEDKWLVSRLQSTIADATRYLEASEFHRAIREVEKFVVEDLSRWYVRLVRERVWDEADASRQNAYAVLHESLLATARLLAPFAPHFAESIYQDLTESHRLQSVHMEDWPVADAALTDYDLERDMATIRAAVDAAAYARQKANMKLRWPVATLTFASDDADVVSALQRFKSVILEQANTKDIEVVGGEWEHLELAPVPNKAVIGKTYRQQGPGVLAALAALPQAQLRELRAKLKRGEGAELATPSGDVPVTSEILAFETRLPANTSGADFPGGSVYVDTQVTPALQAEGAARDVTRRVQEMRKTLGLAMDATIHVQLAAPDDFRALVEPHLADVAQSTRAASLAFVEKPKGSLVKEWDLEGTTLVIGVGTKAPKVAAPPIAKATKALAKKAVAKKTAPAKATKAKPTKAAKKAQAKKAPAKKAAAKPKASAKVAKKAKRSVKKRKR